MTSQVPCGLSNVTLSHYLRKITPHLTPWPCGWLVVNGHPYLEPPNTGGSLELGAKPATSWIPNWNFNQWHSLPLSPSSLHNANALCLFKTKTSGSKLSLRFWPVMNHFLKRGPRCLRPRVHSPFITSRKTIVVSANREGGKDGRPTDRPTEQTN